MKTIVLDTDWPNRNSRRKHYCGVCLNGSLIFWTFSLK